VERIRAEVGRFPADVTTVMYGSEARGDARPDSDIDLLLLVDRENVSADEKQELVNGLFDIEYDSGILINPVVVPKRHWGATKTPFYENVMKEGVLL
jgi:predicted nucleotidyltransferase